MIWVSDDIGVGVGGRPQDKSPSWVVVYDSWRASVQKQVAQPYRPILVRHPYRQPLALSADCAQRVMDRVALMHRVDPPRDQPLMVWVPRRQPHPLGTPRDDPPAGPVAGGLLVGVGDIVQPPAEPPKPAEFPVGHPFAFSGHSTDQPTPPDESHSGYQGPAECRNPGCNQPVRADGLCAPDYARRYRQQHHRPAADPWLIPPDHVIDFVAIEIATIGLRPVRLSDTERQLVACRILAVGGSVAELGRHLNVSYAEAAQLARVVRLDHQTGGCLWGRISAVPV